MNFVITVVISSVIVAILLIFFRAVGVWGKLFWDCYKRHLEIEGCFRCVVIPVGFHFVIFFILYLTFKYCPSVLGSMVELVKK